MDKYEYKLKTEQMLELMGEGAYDKAAEVADTIDWKRVRNVTMLSNVSEIYEKNHDYQKSYEIMNLAYHRADGSRKIVSRLCTLALKTKNVDEAIDYYDDFVQIAPKDPNRFLLRYQILKAQRAPIEQQIEALEEFKKAEYIEEWAYELAKLYQAAGMTSECLEECDDLILWFSEGKYVYQAMELKMKHKPLTPSQQEKYDNRYEKLSSDTEEMPDLAEYDEEEAEEEEDIVIPETKTNEEEAPEEKEEAPKPSVPGKKKLGNTMKLDEALKALLHLGEPEKKEEEEEAAEEAEVETEAETVPEEEPEENLEELEDAIQEIESVMDLGLAEEIKEEKRREATKVDSDLEELTVDDWDEEESEEKAENDVTDVSEAAAIEAADEAEKALEAEIKKVLEAAVEIEEVPEEEEIEEAEEEEYEEEELEAENQSR